MACSPAPSGVAAPQSRNSSWGRGLSERSEFRSPRKRDWGKGTPWGHARAQMVLGPFAETKGPRRAGAKPRGAKTTVDTGASTAPSLFRRIPGKRVQVGFSD